MALHNSLTGSDLHENKGVASASDNTVATASGGTTVWKLLTSGNLDPSSIKNTNQLTSSGLLPDASTSSSTVYLPLPANCVVNSVAITLNASITGTAIISFYNGATLMGSQTLTGPLSAGQSYVVAFNSNNSFVSPAAFKAISGGGSTGTCPVSLTITLTLS